MIRYFLWRENYIDYLWATNVTAKSYFFCGGLLIYENNVLSAFIFKEELEYAKNIAVKRINSIEKISKFSKKFEEIEKEINDYIKSNKKINLIKKSNKELYKSFTDVFNYFRKFVLLYRYTEPHVVKYLEDEAFSFLDNKNKKNIKSEIIMAEIMSSGKDKSKILRKYNLTKHNVIFEVLEKSAKMRFKAKKNDEKLTEYSEKLLREVARRKLIAVSQISHFSQNELRNLLIYDKIPNLYKINLRQSDFGVKIDKNKIIDLIQKEVKKIIRQERKKLDIKFIKGTIAYPGLVEGIVKIIPPLSGQEEYYEYIKTLTSKDIIIASMASPNLATSFKIVKGVITDEGGITSHAALISRETKIPCIVGTKYATNFFSNGEKIILNANKGIIYKK